MTEMTPELREKFRKVKLLALDVDGVLTDGGVYVFEDGREFRRFDIKDGAGLKLLIENGITVAIISAGLCTAIFPRAETLGINYIYIGVKDKLKQLRTICAQKKVEMSEACYIGDDVGDLLVMKAVGLACSPADAVIVIKEISNYISNYTGGRGSVREICGLIIDAKYGE